LSYIAKPEKPEGQKENNNVKLQTRKTDYSTQKPTSLKPPVHRLTTKYDLSIQPPPGGFFMCASWSSCYHWNRTSLPLWPCDI